MCISTKNLTPHVNQPVLCQFVILDCCRFNFHHKAAIRAVKERLRKVSIKHLIMAEKHTEGTETANKSDKPILINQPSEKDKSSKTLQGCIQVQLFLCHFRTRSLRGVLFCLLCKGP